MKRGGDQPQNVAGLISPCVSQLKRTCSLVNYVVLSNNAKLESVYEYGVEILWTKLPFDILNTSAIIMRVFGPSETCLKCVWNTLSTSGMAWCQFRNIWNASGIILHLFRTFEMRLESFCICSEHLKCTWNHSASVQNILNASGIILHLLRTFEMHLESFCICSEHLRFIWNNSASVQNIWSASGIILHLFRTFEIHLE
jgi:hypothetical protein